MIDQRKIPLALLGLGGYDFPWWRYDRTPRYPSVGYYPVDAFDPGEWVMSYPNPAFEKRTRRDAFWGAKIVMSFRDDDLEAIVETAQMPNPGAEAHLLDLLKKRRDKVGRYWFRRINPLDRFAIRAGSAVVAARNGGRAAETPVLTFDDLSVTYDLADAESRTYAFQIRHDGEVLVDEKQVDAPVIPLRRTDASLRQHLSTTGATTDEERVVRIDIRTHDSDGHVSRPTLVYVVVPATGGPRVVGLERK
jgi:hypothetical protein